MCYLTVYLSSLFLFKGFWLPFIQSSLPYLCIAEKNPRVWALPAAENLTLPVHQDSWLLVSARLPRKTQQHHCHADRLGKVFIAGIHYSIPKEKSQLKTELCRSRNSAAWVISTYCLHLSDESYLMQSY